MTEPLQTDSTRISSREERYWLLGLLFVSLTLYVVALNWGLPAYRSWSPDDMTPVGVLRTAQQKFMVLPDYPPVHYALLALAYAPYIAFLLVTGGLSNPMPDFPYGLTNPLEALTVLIVLGRLISAAMGVGIVYLVYLATKTFVADARVALLAGAAAAFNVQLVLFAHLGNVDVPWVFWLAFAFLWFARLVRDWKPHQAVLLAIGAALSVGTKEVAYAPIVGMGVVLGFVWLRQRRAFKPLAAGLVAFLIAYAIANNVILGWEGYSERLMGRIGGPGQWLAGPKWENWTRRPDPGLATQVRLAKTLMTNFITSAGWPLFVAILIGIPLAWRRNKTLLFSSMVPAFLYYAGVVPIQRDVNPRYILPWVVLLAPLAGVALARILDSRLRPLAKRAALGAIVGSSLLWGLRMDWELLTDARYDAEAYLKSAVPAGSRVEVYSYLMYLPRVQEAGFPTCRISPSDSPELLTSEALAVRAPDVILLSSNYFSRFGPPLDAYFDSLVTERLGYRSTVFRGGGPKWPGWSGNWRVNPTIWVLERNQQRDRDTIPGAAASESCPGTVFSRASSGPRPSSDRGTGLRTP